MGRASMSENHESELDREYGFSIKRLSFIVVALLVGQEIQKVLLYPDIAYLVRDTVSYLFRSLNYNVIKVNSSEGIGVSFNDFGRRISPTEVDVLHGLLSPGCIIFSPFLALATDFLLVHLKKSINARNVNLKSWLKISLKLCLILLLFLPFTFFRFVIVLMVFLILWDTSLWSVHYIIGHDIIGNIILILGVVLIYCYLMHYDYWKIQISNFLIKVKILRLCV